MIYTYISYSYFNSFSGTQRVKLDHREIPSTVDWPLMRESHLDFGVKLHPSGWVVSAIKAVEAQFEKTTG